LRDEFDDGRLGEASLQSATNRARQGLSRSGDVITDNSGQIWQLRRDRSRDVARGDYYWHQLQYTPEYSNVSGRQGIQQWRWASPGETGTQPAYVVPNLLQYYEEEPGVGYYIDREDPTPASTREWADRIGLDLSDAQISDLDAQMAAARGDIEVPSDPVEPTIEPEREESTIPEEIPYDPSTDPWLVPVEELREMINKEVNKATLQEQIEIVREEYPWTYPDAFVRESEARRSNPQEGDVVRGYRGPIGIGKRFENGEWVDIPWDSIEPAGYGGRETRPRVYGRHTPQLVAGTRRITADNRVYQYTGISEGWREVDPTTNLPSGERVGHDAFSAAAEIEEVYGNDPSRTAGSPVNTVAPAPPDTAYSDWERRMSAMLSGREEEPPPPVETSQFGDMTRQGPFDWLTIVPGSEDYSGLDIPIPRGVSTAGRWASSLLDPDEPAVEPDRGGETTIPEPEPYDPSTDPWLVPPD